MASGGNNDRPVSPVVVKPDPDDGDNMPPPPLPPALLRPLSFVPTSSVFSCAPINIVPDRPISPINITPVSDSGSMPHIRMPSSAIPPVITLGPTARSIYSASRSIVDNIPIPVMMLSVTSAAQVTGAPIVLPSRPPTIVRTLRPAGFRPGIAKQVVCVVSSGGARSAATSNVAALTSDPPLGGFQENNTGTMYLLGTGTAGSSPLGEEVCGLVRNNCVYCNFCFEQFTGFRTFVHHLNSHVFQCAMCAFRAFTRFGIMEHVSVVHPLHTIQDELMTIRLDSGALQQSSTRPAFLVTKRNAQEVLKSAPPPPPTSAHSSVTMLSLPNIIRQVTRPIAVGRAVLQPRLVNATPVTATRSSSASALLQTTATTRPQATELLILPPNQDSVVVRRNHYMTKLQHANGSILCTHLCFMCPVNCPTVAQMKDHLRQRHSISVQDGDDITDAEGLALFLSANNTPTGQGDDENWAWQCIHCALLYEDQKDVIVHVLTQHPDSELKVRKAKVLDMSSLINCPTALRGAKFVVSGWDTNPEEF